MEATKQQIRELAIQLIAHSSRGDNYKTNGVLGEICTAVAALQSERDRLGGELAALQQRCKLLDAYPSDGAMPLNIQRPEFKSNYPELAAALRHYFAAPAPESAPDDVWIDEYGTHRNDCPGYRPAPESGSAEHVWVKSEKNPLGNPVCSKCGLETTFANNPCESGSAGEAAG
jgi:hypothetical protein